MSYVEMLVSQELIDAELRHTLPPEITDLAAVTPTVFYDDFLGINPSTPPSLSLFSETLDLACSALAVTGQSLFLDTMRRKWPEAVDAALPKAVETTLQWLERSGHKTSAAGMAALVVMAAESEPVLMTAMSAGREPAQMAAMV